MAKVTKLALESDRPGYDHPGMATYAADIDAYEWQLALPPAGVRALLAAVCIDQSHGPERWDALRHLLWGFKSWKIRFIGDRFELSPLGRNNFHQLFGPRVGLIKACPTGACVSLQFATSKQQRRLVRLVLGGCTAVFALIVSTLATASLPAPWMWLTWPARVLAPLWFGLGFGWLVPRSVTHEPIDFLDEVFAAYIQPTKPLARQELASETVPIGEK